MFRNVGLAILVSTSLFIQGCGEKSAEEYLTLATEAVAKGDNETAVIQLKNVLRVEPKNADARFLLGKMHIERGDWASAQKELERALDYNYEPAAVVPLIAEAYRKMGADSKLLKLDLKSKGIKKRDLVKIKYYQVKAFVQSEQTSKALAVIDEIKQISTSSEFKQLTAYLEYKIKEQQEAAMLQLEAVLKQSPDHPEAVLLMALEALKSSDVERGIEMLAKYREIAPLEYEYHFLLAQLYVDYKRLDEAEVIVDELLQINPNQPYLNQIKALVRFGEQDYENALKHANISVSASPEDITVRLIAGSAAFALKKYDETHQHLSLVASELPDDHQALRILAKTQLILGYTLEANDTVQRFVELDNEDAQLLSSVATALSQSGEKIKAGKLVARNADQKFEGKSLTQYGLVKLSLNDVSGILDLENSLADLGDEEESKLEVQRLLANAYIADNKLDKAKRIADNWLTIEETKFDGHMLMGAIFLRQKDFPEAKKQFSEALTIAPNNEVVKLAIINLEPIQTVDQQKAALAKIDDLLAQHPAFIPAVLRRYVLANVLQQPNKMLAHLEGLRQSDTGNIKLAEVLGKMYLLEKQTDKAIAVFESVKTAEPSAFWQSLANAYVANSNFEKAVEIYREWFDKQPNNAIAIFGMARVHQLRGELQKALELTTKFKEELGGSDVKIDLFHIQMLISNNKMADAKTKLAELPKYLADRPYVKGLKGQLQLVDKNYQAAKANLKQAYEARPTPDNAALVMQALKHTEGDQVAFQFLAEHVKNQPEDQSNIMRLAGYQISHDRKAAIQSYYQAVSLNENNFIALNNLAFLLMEQGDLDKAEEYGNKALALQPANASVMDTLATIAIAQGDYSKAETLLANAMESTKDDIDDAIFVNYVEVLFINKNNKLATRMLERHEVTQKGPMEKLQAIKAKYNI